MSEAIYFLKIVETFRYNWSVFESRGCSQSCVSEWTYSIPSLNNKPKYGYKCQGVYLDVMQVPPFTRDPKSVLGGEEGLEPDSDHLLLSVVRSLSSSLGMSSSSSRRTRNDVQKRSLTTMNSPSSVMMPSELISWLPIVLQLIPSSLAFSVHARRFRSSWQTESTFISSPSLALSEELASASARSEL